MSPYGGESITIYIILFNSEQILSILDSDGCVPKSIGLTISLIHILFMRYNTDQFVL